MNLGREDQSREFKESLAELDAGLRSLAAMLNRDGYGEVYFGVRDNGEVKGLETGKDSVMKIRSRIRNLIRPQILADIQVEASEDGKQYIRVSAHGREIPYSFNGRYYVRNAAADESASNELLRKMLATADHDLLREIPSDVQELSFDTFRDVLGNQGVRTRYSRAFYNNYGLYTREGQFNLMALLLSEQNPYSMKVVRFAGTDKTVMSERWEFGNRCLLDTVREVLRLVRMWNTVRVDLSQGKREEQPMFHFEAFREAWVNACLHNRWSDRVPPSVYVFDDRIEIVSYGGLPYGLSLDDFYKGKSLPVNSGLFNIFILAGYAEQSGHGVPVIVSSYGEQAFEVRDAFLTVILPFTFEPDHVAARKKQEREKTTLTGNQIKVYEYLASHSSATLQETANACDISLSGVKKIVARLRELDLLERTGSRRTGFWLTK